MQTMSDTPLKPATQVLARRLPGGAVLVHLGTNRIFELNETGAKVWELLSEGLDNGQILQRLIEEFAVEPALAAADLRTVLEQLEREGLLTTP